MNFEKKVVLDIGIGYPMSILLLLHLVTAIIFWVRLPTPPPTPKVGPD